MNATINSWLEILSKLISVNIWLAPLLAFLAGVLTSFTPCSLTSVPLIIGYVGVTVENDTKKALRLSVLFSLGLALTLTVLGTLASLLGRLMQGGGSWWYILLGSLMILMALQTWEIINLIPSSYALGKNKRRGYLGAFLAGILGGFFSSPCATPVLIALLSLVAGEGSLISGVVLLLMYSLGHSVLIIIAGTSVGFVQRISKSEQYGALSKVIRVLMGIAILIIGIYMLYLGF
jgi:cytochrome c-type biogenesis protein